MHLRSFCVISVTLLLAPFAGAQPVLDFAKAKVGLYTEDYKPAAVFSREELADAEPVCKIAKPGALKIAFRGDHYVVPFQFLNLTTKTCVAASSSGGNADAVVAGSLGSGGCGEKAEPFPTLPACPAN